MKSRWIVAILLLAAALRLGLLAAAWNAPPRLFKSDSPAYHALAVSLATDARFEESDRPETFRTPGYPIFLAPAIAFGDSWWRAAAAFQIALDVGLVYLTFLLGSRLCSPRVGAWAAVFQAVSDVALVSSVRILSEGVFTFLLVAAALLLVRHFRTGGWRSLIGAAVVTAAACYVRPAGAAWLAAAGIVLAMRKGGLTRAAAFVAVVLASLLPWVIRNGVTAGFWGFTSLSAEVAIDYQAPAILAEREGISFEQARAKMQDELRRRLPPSGEEPPGRLAEEQYRLGSAVVRQNPWTYARIHLVGDKACWLPAATDILEILGVTQGGANTLEVLRRDGLSAAIRNYFGGRLWAAWLCVPLVAILAAEYLLAALGAASQLRLRMGAAKWLILLAVILFMLAPGPASHPRFRTPVSPFLCLAAAAGLAALSEWRRRRDKKVIDRRS
jgi:hypothetical protein